MKSRIHAGTSKALAFTLAGLLAILIPAGAAPKCQLGVVNLATVNGGINPATTHAWALGDTYRLVFITSTGTPTSSTNIATYNSFVQGVAAGSTTYPKLANALWNVAGSTQTVDATVNTGTNTGTGVATLLMNGTVFATSNSDLWNGANVAVQYDQNGVAVASGLLVATGSEPGGTHASTDFMGSTGNVQSGVGTTTAWMKSWHVSPTGSTPVYAISGLLTIVDSADATLPTLTSIATTSPGTVSNPATVPYTVTFSKPMSVGSVDITDFENDSTIASPVGITVNSVVPTANPTVFTVSVSTNTTPIASGNLRLRIKQGATLADLPGNKLVTTSALSTGSPLIAVGADTTPPTLVSIVDNVSGGPIVATKTNTPTYTVTFSEAINPTTMVVGDFENGSTAPLTINSVTQTGPAVFQVVTTTTGPGNIVLRIKQGAVIKDLAGNNLVTTSALSDDTTITVNPAPALAGQLGILDVVNANGGINPATGNIWALGDKYRLAFVTRATTQATSTDIATYNTFVQNVANNSNLNLSGATWKVIGSTATVDALDNTLTNPLFDGTGEAIFLVDGTTKIANKYDDLWDSSINSNLNLDEKGAAISTGPFTGSSANGMKDIGNVLGNTTNLTIGSTTSTSSSWMRVFNAPPTSSQSVYALSNPLTVVSSVPLANITSFTFPSYGPATISSANINMTVPYGTSLTSLAPTYTLSVGATCVPASGSSQNFTSPVHYVVTASDLSTKDFTVTVVNRSIADPQFTLTAPATWDGRQTITVQSTITNQALLQATGGTNVNYHWSVAGVAVTKQITPGTLTLTRSQGNGPLTVTLTMDNGGQASSQSVTVNIQQPATDAWVQRTPGGTEKPVTGQFYARNPNTNNGTIFYNGTGAGTTPVYLKVFATPSGGAEAQYGATLRQTPVAGVYAFTVPIAAGLVTYRVEFGTTSGSTDTPTNTVTNLVCGDAFIIEGQSNALATDNTVPADTNTSPWIRSYGKTVGWGYATNKDSQSELQLGVWGWYLAKRLTANNNMPVCIINGAVGGTRIDQHQPNPADHSQAGSLYSIYADLYNRVVGAKLTHGIRGVLWHQGEQDQGTGGPFGGDYDYKFYQQYFVDMSAAWKQDFPNILNYYIFQIWPPACGDQSRNDQLREMQRSLPFMFSNMKIMSTLGIVPGSSCHYDGAGYQKFSDLIGPLVEQDAYGVATSTVFAAANLKKAYFTTATRNEIALEFDQVMAPWINAANALFFLDRLAGNVSSGTVSGKVIKLQLSAASQAKTITYLKGLDWDGNQTNLVYGSNAIAALTFADVPISPQALAQTLTTPEDIALAVTLSGTATSGSTFTYTVLSPPTHGTLSGTAPNLTYTPAIHYYGTDSFTFKVNDGTLDSTAATVNLTVTPVNYPPVAQAQNLTTTANTALPVTLTATDVEGSPLTYAIVSQPAHGALSGSAPAVTYTPASNYSGPDSFTFKANDGALDSAPATVGITVSATAYSTWALATAQGLTTGVNDHPLDDPDHDGIPNLMEFALGGAPMASSQAILPKLTKSGAGWAFEYDRSAASRPTATTQVVEYGSNLTGWTPVTIPATSGGTVTITTGTSTDHVSVAIPNPGGQLFVRLRVSQ